DKGPKMDQFLSTTPAPTAPEVNASAVNTEGSGGASPGSEDFPSGLSSESVSFLREVRRMIQQDVQEEIRKVGSDVLVVKDCLQLMTTEVSKLGTRVSEAEDRVSRLEDDNKSLGEQVRIMAKTIVELQARVEYQENYCRRSNLRLRGVPELGQDDMECVKDILKSLFKDTHESVEDIIIERAHRVPPGPIRNQDNPPRIILAKFLRFMDREKVRLRARKLGAFIWNGARVDFFPDLTREVQEKRRKFAEVKRICTEKGLRYSMQYPAILWINVGDQRQRFQDAAAAKKALLKGERSNKYWGHE
uniref:L1 transposable element RRM domain-containing protein n=1 Tax=Neogobius melanostomus TaxID=47308 RepID=A0A8C6UKB2_9GOBI